MYPVAAVHTAAEDTRDSNRAGYYGRVIHTGVMLLIGHTA